MSNPRKSLCLVLVIATAGLITGCEASVSTGGGINSDEVADQIKQKYPAKADGLTLTSITCGSGDPEVGATFTCDAENNAGVTLEIEGTVTEVNEEADDVKFTTKTIKATSNGEVYATTAVDTLVGEGYAVESMTCPEIVIEEGNVVECDVTMDNGTSQTATLTLTDGNGGFDVVTSGPKPG